MDKCTSLEEDLYSRLVFEMNALRIGPWGKASGEFFLPPEREPGEAKSRSIIRAKPRSELLEMKRNVQQSL